MNDLTPLDGLKFHTQSPVESEFFFFPFADPDVATIMIHVLVVPDSTHIVERIRISMHAKPHHPSRLTWRS